MPKPDLLAEHANLLSEGETLRQLIARDLAASIAQTNRARRMRLEKIEQRMAAIERTKTWQRSHVPVPATHHQVDLEELIDDQN